MQAHPCSSYLSREQIEHWLEDQVSKLDAEQDFAVVKASLRTLEPHTSLGNAIHVVTLEKILSRGDSEQDADNGEKSKRIDVLLLSGLHAREWVALASNLCTLTTLVDALIQKPSPCASCDPSATSGVSPSEPSPAVSNLMKQLQRGEISLQFLILANPDGYEYSMQGLTPRARAWRKNRSEVKADTRNNEDERNQSAETNTEITESTPVSQTPPDPTSSSFFDFSNPRRRLFRIPDKEVLGIGVDLNRNFGIEGLSWGHGDPNKYKSEVYQGQSAFSELESQAVREAVHTLVDKKSAGVTGVLDVHCCARTVLAPKVYGSRATAEAGLQSTLNQAAKLVADEMASLQARLRTKCNANGSLKCGLPMHWRPREQSWSRSNSGIAVDWIFNEGAVDLALIVEVSL
jgi:hypothetical protein